MRVTAKILTYGTLQAMIKMVLELIMIALRGLSPKFVDKACKIVIRQNKIMCVYGHVGKAYKVCGISSVLMKLLKCYDDLIAQYHTRTMQFSNVNDADMIKQ